MTIFDCSPPHRDKQRGDRKSGSRPCLAVRTPDPYPQLTTRHQSRTRRYFPLLEQANTEGGFPYRDRACICEKQVSQASDELFCPSGELFCPSGPLEAGPVATQSARAGSVNPQHFQRRPVFGTW